jgi:hypothetical protein
MPDQVRHDGLKKDEFSNCDTASDGGSIPAPGRRGGEIQSDYFSTFLEVMMLFKDN